MKEIAATKEITVSGSMINFLIDLKNSVLNTKDRTFESRVGYLACASYLDEAISTIVKQQTRIADLLHLLAVEREYASAWGDFFGCTPQEMTREKQSELRQHMESFEKKWKAELEAQQDAEEA